MKVTWTEPVGRLNIENARLEDGSEAGRVLENYWGPPRLKRPWVATPLGRLSYYYSPRSFKTRESARAWIEKIWAEEPGGCIPLAPG